MFSRKRTEQIQKILETMQKDREMFAEQAEKDRVAMTAQIATLKSDTNALIETMNKDREMLASSMAAQVSALKNDTAQLSEAMNKGNVAFAEQAEKDRQVILEYIEAIKEKPDEPAIEKGEELQAAYALNLCTVSVSQIIDYNDLVIMEQEYDNILNNLNLQNFPKDEALLKILKQILDVISFFRIQDGEKKLLEEQYKKKVKNAIWSAVPSPSVILAGGKAGWAGLAVSAISAVGTGYMNYRKERATIDDEKRQKDWELQKAAMEQFHALRRELFDTAWRLADAYDFKDCFRLTARQISQYNKILTDTDAIKRYERLDYMKDNFVAYPPFWYNLGHAAAEVYHNKDFSDEVRSEYKEKAIEAFDNFENPPVDEKIKSTVKGEIKSLLREDPLRAACALEKFALIVGDENIKSVVKQALLVTAAQNAGNAFDTLQLCASSYLELGDTAEAIKLLRMLVNEGYNPEMNAQLLSVMYVSSIKNKDENKDNYKNDHETLSKRGYGAFMFSWPQIELDDDAEKKFVQDFLEEQNRYLFEEYKIAVGDYISQCQNEFDEITELKADDISEELVNFLKGIKTDLEVLFEEGFAEGIVNLLAGGLLEHNEAIGSAEKRRQDKLFRFNVVGESAIRQMAKKIKLQAADIKKNATGDEGFKVVGNYMNNLFLFKAQAKLLGGMAIVRNNEKPSKTEFEKLIEQSRKNQADENFMKVVREYEKENKLILDNGKKSKVNFITINVAETAERKVKTKHKNIVSKIAKNKLLAYLDTNDDDILFTTEGLYRFGNNADFAPYNSGKIKLIENKLHIANLTFEHKQVDLKVLNEMIEKLSQSAPRERADNLQFMEMVGEFPQD